MFFSMHAFHVVIAFLLRLQTPRMSLSHGSRRVAACTNGLPWLFLKASRPHDVAFRYPRCWSAERRGSCQPIHCSPLQLFKSGRILTPDTLHTGSPLQGLRIISLFRMPPAGSLSCSHECSFLIGVVLNKPPHSFVYFSPTGSDHSCVHCKVSEALQDSDASPTVRRETEPCHRQLSPPNSYIPPAEAVSNLEREGFTNYETVAK